MIINKSKKKSAYKYKLLDPETVREIGQFVFEYIREEQAASPDDNLLEFINNLLGKNDPAPPPDYLRKTRRLLKRIRAGTASEDEIAVVMNCIQQMNSRAQNTLDKRRLYVLAVHFLAQKTLTITEIARKFSVDKATIYRDVNSVTERLTSLIYRHYAPIKQ